MSASLLLAAGLLAVGTIVAGPSRTRRSGLWTQTAAAALAAGVAAAVLATGTTVGSPFVDGVHPALGLDPLSAFFVIVIAGTAVPILIYAGGYLAEIRRGGALGALTGAFLIAMLLVVCARDISTFLAGWELMTLIPAAAILVHRTDRDVRYAAFVYLAVTHLGGVGVWLTLILLSDAGALSQPAMFAEQQAALQWTVWIAALVGFGVKAGLMPMHVWLPLAHPVAPSTFSALMSGVMLKVAVYGLVRVLFFWTGPVPVGVAVALLLVGALSCVGGVLYALFQHELKRLLAFHSIENIGIIALGLGAALLFETADQPLWASLAFAAALLHTLNHAVFKSLLFLGAGAIQRSTHALGIDRLGGLLRRMPWTAWFFILGAAAIAGVPPLNGFVSEWLTLQSLIHLALDGAGAAWVGPLAAAALASTAALAVLCFVKVVGLSFLGHARTRKAATATEVGFQMKAGQAILAASCIVLGILPALLLPSLADLRGVEVDVPSGLGMTLPGTGGLPMPAIALALVAIAVVLVLLRSRRPAAPAAPTWVCGQEVEPSLDWTSSSFTKPVRLSWDAVLRPEREVTIRARNGVTQTLTYEGAVPHLFETKVFVPVQRGMTRAFTRARRLQSGRLRNYALYLFGLLGVLLLLARLGGGG